MIISSITYSFAYGTISLNALPPGRYNLVILPIYSIITGYSVAIIYQWAKAKNKIFANITVFIIAILITLKTFLIYHSEVRTVNKNFKIEYNLTVKIIDSLAKNFKLSKEDFFTKVGIGFFDDKLEPENHATPNYHFYINNMVNNNELKTYDHCLVVLINNKKNSYHKVNKKNLLKKISSDENLFGSRILINKTLYFKDFLIIEYKPFYGDCAKNLLNDYIITKEEKETLKYLLDKENNTFFSSKSKNLNKYYLNIKNKEMKYPVDILLEFRNTINSLLINLHSNRLRNSSTFLNGYWDSTKLLNPMIIFNKNDTNDTFEIPLIEGILGEGFIKTPLFISTSELSTGNYTVRFLADELYETYSDIKIENFDKVVDDNFYYIKN